MRAVFLALALVLLAPAACRSAGRERPAAPVQAHVTPREQFMQLMERWDAAWNAVQPGIEVSEAHPEFAAMYAECESLAPEVPEALQFCINLSWDSSHLLWGPLRKPGPLTVFQTVRAAPDSESVDRCLWKLWTGSEPDGETRYVYLGTLSGLRDLPRGSLARGWGELAMAVWVHGIGAPDALSHEPKLALDALGGIEADYPGTVVARHAQALRRSVAAFDTAAPAPALDLVDILGQSLTLDAECQHCALVLFWDPADTTSAKVLARIQQLDVRAQWIGVQVGGDAADVTRLLPRNCIPCRTAIVAGWKDPVLERWGVRALPASFLVDPQGRVRAIDQFGPALNRSAKALAENTFVEAGMR